MKNRHLLALVYGLTLLASHGVRSWTGYEPAPRRDQSATFLPSPPVRICWQSWEPETEGPHETVLLLHGSPGSSSNFRGLGESLAEHGYRVLAPDLPGFGRSSSDVPDYSNRAHADYVHQWLDEIGIERYHLLGFSMGGGVALRMLQTRPEPIRSLIFLSAIGVQEFEWLGDYRLNHAVHGFQLWCMRVLFESLPHFGALDDGFIDVAYARNFFDTDQRPYRQLLSEYRGPALILHGERDFLIPAPAAREHHRLMRASELQLVDQSHFFLFYEYKDIAERLVDFLGHVRDGEVPDGPPQDMHPPDDGIEGLQGTSLTTSLLSLATAYQPTESPWQAARLLVDGRLRPLTAGLAVFFGLCLVSLLVFLPLRLLASLLPLPSEGWREAIRGKLWTLALVGRLVPFALVPACVLAALGRVGVVRFSLWAILSAALASPLLLALGALWTRL